MAGLGEICNNSTVRCNVYKGLYCAHETPLPTCQCLSSLKVRNGKCDMARLGEQCNSDSECNAQYEDLRVAHCVRQNRQSQPTCLCNGTHFEEAFYSIYNPYLLRHERISVGTHCEAKSSRGYANEGEQCHVTIPQQHSKQLRPSSSLPQCRRDLLCYHCPELGSFQPHVGRCIAPDNIIKDNVATINYQISSYALLGMAILFVTMH